MAKPKEVKQPESVPASDEQKGQRKERRGDKRKSGKGDLVSPSQLNLQPKQEGESTGKNKYRVVQKEKPADFEDDAIVKSEPGFGPEKTMEVRERELQKTSRLPKES